MQMSSLILAVAAALLAAQGASAHVGLRVPAPRNSNTGQKSGPCGGYAMGAANSGTPLRPGTIYTVRWQETINHLGAPFRLAISCGSDGDYNQAILADHIPHDDRVLTDFPGGKYYEYNITVPDIDCPQGGLQLVNPMTDKIPADTCCCYADGGNGTDCFSVYHSCADISISGSQNYATWLAGYSYGGPTGSYTQESRAWDNTGSALAMRPDCSVYDSDLLSRCSATCTGQPTSRAASFSTEPPLCGATAPPPGPPAPPGAPPSAPTGSSNPPPSSASGFPSGNVTGRIIGNVTSSTAAPAAAAIAVAAIAGAAVALQ